jgi:voltage-gated potassium channel
MTSVLSLLAYAVVGAYVLGPQFSPPIEDFVTALYFAVVSMSTVGYGDIAPKTPEARLFVVSIIILGITVFATSLSALLVPLINRRVQLLLRSRGGTMGRADHYVIVSESALARNSYKELKARDQKVTFILDRAPEHDDEHLDVVVGDASDLDVLRRADGQNAKAILALSDDDSENAFVVLAAKELAGSVKTVAVVNDARNLARIKRVHPDLIIAPHILGGELLAMALSGEDVQGEHLMRQLLQFGS